ncbi:MSHA biogenesis protein MshP [Alteromonadaceae bacterium Bs31]|nr:MSHA biogenesis protein MshP [Alteromonadaceae bacterium Bs31]
MYLKMCPKQRQAISDPRKEAGFLIPLALVLLVGISFLVIAINRLSGQTGTSTTVEGLSAQAFYAAESGAQYGMSRLFFDMNTRAQTDANCGAMGTTINFTAPGLALCSAQVSCTRSVDASNTTSFYIINSLGRCGAAQLIGEREIEVSASMQ